VTLLYNSIMAAVDLAVLALAQRSKSVRAWRGGMACAGIAACLLALALGEDAFGCCRLLAWGVFLHAVVLLVGSAVIWWPTRRILATGSAAAAAGILLVALDAFLIEPNWLDVSYFQLGSQKIPHPIRVVVLADLQTDRIGQYEREIFGRALAEKPDLLLLAGDYVQAGGTERQELCDRLNALLRGLDLPGSGRAFAVQGNVDPDSWAEMFRGTAVTAVQSTETFDVAGIQLTCLTRHDSFSPSLEVRSPDPARFHLVLGHAPDFALGRIEADLLLAGHTHGGQVRLPLIGPLLTLSAVRRNWAAGLTELPSGSRLLVSRGVGLERANAPRLRFLCRPELVVIDLIPQPR
jgi:hypothetical protein